MSHFIAMPGAIANGNLSTSQFYAVKMTTNDDFEIGVCTAAADFAIGLLQNDPNTSGHAAEVAILGVAIGQVNGTIGRGEFLGIDAAGRLGTVAVDGTSGITFLARSLQDGSSGENIFVYLHGPVILSST